MNDRYSSPDPLRGMIAGAIAGLVASWAMNQFQYALSKVSSARDSDTGSQQQQQQGESEDATMKTANRIAEMVLGRPLSMEEKKKAGPIVHYGFGASVGAMYGLGSEYWPSATNAFGLLFGLAVFGIADEAAVPIFGLSGKPTEYPLSSHLSALASHLIYGASAEAVRRKVREVA